MRERRAFALAFAAVFVAGAGAVLVPALLRTRDVVVATPVPAPLRDVAPVTVLPYALLCIPGVEATQHRAVARLLRARPGAPVALAVELRGAAGASVRVSAVAPAAAGAVDVALPPLPRAPDGALCLRNRGSGPIVLVGSSEPRTAAAPVATLDDRPLAQRVALTMLEPGRRSLLARAPAVLAHATAFRGGLLGRPLLWALLAAVVVALPAGVVASMFCARTPSGR